MQGRVIFNGQYDQVLKVLSVQIMIVFPMVVKTFGDGLIVRQSKIVGRITKFTIVTD
jgi:hypothetical protein